VNLTGGPVIHDFSKWLDRLDGSDMWYRSETIPNDARFVYSFQINRAAKLPTDEAGQLQAWKRSPPQADPLNPKAAYDGSVLELAEAPAEPWLDHIPAAPQPISKLFAKLPGVTAGDVREHKIDSDRLKQARRFTVYTPPGYSSRRGGDRDDRAERYRFLVLFEGSGCIELLNNLIVQKRMPPVVMVVPSFVDRNKECACSEPFADFIAAELVPWMREHYRVSADAERTIVGGFSYSGLAAGFCALRHPRVFGNALTMSGSYWWFPQWNEPDALSRGEPGWLTRQFVSVDRVPVRFFLAAGRFEDYYPWSLLAENRRLRDVLQAKGYRVDFREFTGGHDPVSWRGSLVEGLVTLTTSQAPSAL
jgi:enterochelin esterase family protein